MSAGLNKHSHNSIDKNRIYLYVDFNEMVDQSCYLLSKTDIKTDRYGNEICIVEHMPISGFMPDINQEGQSALLVIDGYAELNDGRGGWPAEQVKWCIRVQENGFRWEND